MLQLVEPVVAADHVLGQGHVAAHHRLDGVAHLGLGQAAHARHLGLELVQLFAKELQGVFVHAHDMESGLER